MRRKSRSHALLAVAAAVTMSMALGIPVAADLNLIAGEAAHISYTNGDGVNVRENPGFNGGIFTTLDEGVAVEVIEGPVILDDGTGWYLVYTADYDFSGWVIADYLSAEAGQGVAPTMSLEAVSVTTAVIANTEGSGLRLRDGATFDAGIITVMPDGAAVEVIATDIFDAAGYAWSQVEFDGMTGYAAAEYLSIGATVGEVADQPVATEPESSGLSAGDRAAVAGTGGGGLNLRGDAGFGANVLTVVAEGEVVTIIDGPRWDAEGNGWYQVDYSSTVGWAHGGYLAWTDVAPTTAPTLGAIDPPAETPPVEQPIVEQPIVEQPVVEQPPAEQPPAEEPVAAVTGIGDQVAAEGLNYVGVPYVWGGTTPSGFDCSGFTYYVVNRVAGVGLSRALEVQAVTGSYVNANAMAPGDLVFFQNTYKWGLSHVGIYVGGGQMVHASSERTGTIISDVWDSYWGPRYYTARRVV